MSNSIHTDYDAESTTSEDSQEPYYHITTGKVVKAREAWAILAAENHPRYAARSQITRVDSSSSKAKQLLGRGDGGSQRINNNRGNNGSINHMDSNIIKNDSFFRSTDGGIITTDDDDSWSMRRDRDERDNTTRTENQDLSPSSFDSNNYHRHIRNDSSFSADPTQSSIDRALHNPESPTASISPYKDMKQVYKPSILTFSSSPYEDGHSSHNSNPYVSNNNGPAEVPPPDDDEEESDPIILRATAMAMAAQNGLKLTPDQLALIAQPDVQQQKLIEEAKRVQKAKEMQLLQQQQQGAINLQSLGADIKKFIRIEKEKPPMQWGADLGKFIESQMMQHATHHGGAGGHSSTTASADKSLDFGQEGKNEDGTGSRPSPSPPKKKMEGFGCDPSISTAPSDTHNTSSSLLLGGKGLAWPSMNIPTPSLPLLNESITNILPGGGENGIRSGSGTTTTTLEMLPSSSISTSAGGIDFNEPVIISTTLWKRRSMGKRNTMMLTSSSPPSWDRICLELRGKKLICYKSDASSSATITLLDGREKKDENIGTPSRTTSENSTFPTPNVDSTTNRLSVLFQAAEQKIQTAKDEFNRLASATGLERKTSSADSSAPLGIIDIVNENASVSASMGHSGAPTPFCLSIRVKSETKWKFSFDGHIEMMEWLSALTDLIVKASVDAYSGSCQEMELYCIQRRTETKHGEMVMAAAISKSLPSFLANAVLWGDGETKWIISLALLNVALILARTSSLQFWKIFFFFNFGMWQQKRYSPETMGNHALTSSGATNDGKWSYKPVAGSTTIKVTKEDDPNTTEKGHQLPSWMPISSSALEVRSHGYLTTKRKIPSPGELYECVAVDCFVSNARVPEIATRMKLGLFEKKPTGKISWKSPDIFIVSIAIPTEAPKLGYSSDDGPGATIVGYFKMKEATRAVLHRITAAGYDPSTDTSNSEIDVQKRLTNGVRLWERFCQEAPTDPTFQARFKLIPSANLEEMGCPSYIAKYNGKPVLIKRKNVTGFFNDYPALNVSEFDVSLHPFPYLFKQGMAYMKEYFDKSVWTLGFVIEGRSNDELPEVVIGAMKICRPSPKYIVNGEELFSGTCSKVVVS